MPASAFWYSPNTSNINILDFGFTGPKNIFCKSLATEHDLPEPELPTIDEWFEKKMSNDD